MYGKIYLYHTKGGYHMESKKKNEQFNYIKSVLIAIFIIFVFQKFDKEKTTQEALKTIK